MPELPELETIVRGLRPRLLGRRFIRARLRHRGLYRRGSLRVPWLVGRLIAAVERIGKNALFRLEPSGLVVINLGMTGRLRVCAPDDVPERRHLHGRFYLDNKWMAEEQLDDEEVEVLRRVAQIDENILLQKDPDPLIDPTDWVLLVNRVYPKLLKNKKVILQGTGKVGALFN